MPDMKALSLFSGCGGDTLGLQRAGFEVVAFSEFNKQAIATHLSNFPESVLLEDPKTKSTDITKLPDSIFEPYKDQIQIIFAGFPCQGFSRAGKKNTTDPRNQMFRQFVRVAKIVNPPFIIGENVTGLLSMKSGPKEEDPSMLDIIIGSFAEIGYKMTYKILEADDFGVPQKRKRLLLVGWKEGVVSLDPPTFWSAVCGSVKQEEGLKMRDFVKPSLEKGLLLHSWAVPPGFDTVALNIPEDMEPTGSPHPYVKLKAETSGESYDGKEFERLLSCGKRDSPIHSEIIDLTLPSKTIICTYEHQPRLLVGLKKPSGKSYVRSLLPDELKQIQGFPASFQVLGNEKDKVVQIGNAVPPALVEAVATQLKKLLTPSSSAPASSVPKARRILKKKATSTS